MTRAELLADLRALVLDPTFTDAVLLREMDNALLQSARLVRVPTLTAAIQVELAPGTASIPMPDDYHHSVYAVEPARESLRFLLVPNLKELLRRAEGAAGGLLLAVQGEQLFYSLQGDETEQITLHYYRKPDSLSFDETAHEWIPAQLHWPIIGGHVLSRVMPFFEDGIGSTNNQTAFYANMFAEALAMLRMAFPDAPAATPARLRRTEFF